MNTTQLAPRLMALALPIALCVAAMHTDAAHAANKKKHGTHKAAASTQHKSGSIKIQNQQNNSGETRAERERRLYRECQGLPNAGACSGYTRR